MNKKGALTDLFVFMIVGVAFVSIVGILIYVLGQTKDQILQQAPALQKSVSVGKMNVTDLMKSTLGRATQSYASLGWITYMIIIAMALSILITSALVKTNPFWFVAYVFVVVVAVIVSVPMSNTYESIYTNPTISSGFTGLMSVSWIMLHLPIWITIIGFIAGILLFINIDWGNPLG